jgi:urease accessory protein
MAITTTDLGLLRLMQLSSASLPVGGYAFSQGLEYAVDSGWLVKSADVKAWLLTQLQHGLARVDIPYLLRLRAALRGENPAPFFLWNRSVLACRETREMLLTDEATGAALLKLMSQLAITHPWLTDEANLGAHASGQPISFVTSFALASHHWGIDDEAACLGLMWSWLENQVAAATKLVPLGQSQAQVLLGELQSELPLALALAKTLQDDELGSSLPALAIASAKHETQYSRLFRS